MSTRREPEQNRLEQIGARVRQRALTGSEASAVGFTLVVYIFAGAGVGYLLDKNLETSYWIAVGTLLGAAVGFREMFRLTKKLTRQSALDESDELQLPETKAADAVRQESPDVIHSDEEPTRPRLFSTHVPPPPTSSFERKTLNDDGDEEGANQSSRQEPNEHS